MGTNAVLPTLAKSQDTVNVGERKEGRNEVLDVCAWCVGAGGGEGHVENYPSG